MKNFRAQLYCPRFNGTFARFAKKFVCVDIEHDFEPKYINIRGKGELIKELKTLAKKADKIYLATDPDREGEAIGWHLAHILGVTRKQTVGLSFMKSLLVP